MTKPLDLRQLDHLAIVTDRSDYFAVLTHEVARMRHGEFSRGRWRLHNSSVRVVQVAGLNIAAHPNPPGPLNHRRQFHGWRHQSPIIGHAKASGRFRFKLAPTYWKISA